MEDSSGSKPFMVTSSLTFQVNTPSFYNQPKKFASVAPPRPKGQIASTATVGRVGEIPPPPSSLGEGKIAFSYVLIFCHRFGIPLFGVKIASIRYYRRTLGPRSVIELAAN